MQVVALVLSPYILPLPVWCSDPAERKLLLNFANKHSMKQLAFNVV